MRDMAGSLQRLPTGNHGEPPLADLYKSAMEEYRFQASFNWSRTQYLLGPNVAVLTAGTVVSSWARGRAGLPPS